MIRRLIEHFVFPDHNLDYVLGQSLSARSTCFTDAILSVTPPLRDATHLIICCGGPFDKERTQSELAMLRDLLDAGLDPNFSPLPGRGLSPVTHCARNGDFQTMDMLFKYGADLNDGNRDALTYVIAASNLTSKRMNGALDYLLERGWDPMDVGYDGKNAMQLAKEKNFSDLEAKLFKYHLASRESSILDEVCDHKAPSRTRSRI